MYAKFEIINLGLHSASNTNLSATEAEMSQPKQNKTNNASCRVSVQKYWFRHYFFFNYENQGQSTEEKEKKEEGEKC